jgi:2'-5' RNA ligase
MRYFIGIVPPKDIQKKIVNFQKHFFSKEVIEPHITIKAQGGLIEDMFWLDKVKSYLKEQSSFYVELKDFGKFDGHVLYIHVSSNDIVRIHNDLIKIINPSRELLEKYFEEKNYIPHLTLAETRWGITKSGLSQIKMKAEQELAIFP